MTIEETIGTVMEAKLAPVRAEVGRLTAEIEALRRTLPPQLVTLAQAARALGLSLSTVRRRVNDGTLPVRRVGGPRSKTIRIDLAELHSAPEAEVVRLVSGLARG